MLTKIGSGFSICDYKGVELFYIPQNTEITYDFLERFIISISEKLERDFKKGYDVGWQEGKEESLGRFEDQLEYQKDEMKDTIKEILALLN